MKCDICGGDIDENHEHVSTSYRMCEHGHETVCDGSLTCPVCDEEQRSETTSTQTHTPGPWSRMNSHKAGFHNIVSWGDDEPQNRKYVCEITPSDTAFCDAALIAAAPDLLQALRVAQATIERLHRHAPGSANGTLDVIKAAIDKATTL